MADRLPANATALRRLACLLDEIDSAGQVQGELSTAISLLRRSNNAALFRQNLQGLRPVLARDERQRYYRPGRTHRQRPINIIQQQRMQRSTTTLSNSFSDAGVYQDYPSAQPDVFWLTSTDPDTDSGSGQLWLRAALESSEQDDRGDLEGFDADNTALELGIDWQVGDVMFGANLGRDSADVDSQRLGNDKIEGNSLGLSAGLTRGKHFISATVAWREGETERQRLVPLVTPGGNRTFFLNADIDTQQFTAELAWSASWDHGDSLALLPYAGITYVKQSTDNYAEFGAGNLSLDVRTNNVTQVIGRVGVAASYSLLTGNWLIAPTAQVGFERDFRADAISTVSQFRDTAFVFTNRGFAVEENRWQYGLGIQFLHLSGFGASFNLTSQQKDDYKATGAAITLQTQF